ncbi:MAG: dienelactone hydrolase family protein [Bacteroidota bacterium]
MPHRNQPLFYAGTPVAEATSAMVLIHGRGALAQGMLDLERVLQKEQMAYVAPQAANGSWYPFRFIADIAQNEPYLTSALDLIDQTVTQLNEAGIATDRIVLGGFSQGACLASEYIARNPMRYGGLLVFSGGLIGPPGQLPDYAGNLNNTPVFIGCSDVDAHIPLHRVEETADIFTDLGGQVTKTIYPGMGHTINTDEIKAAQKILTALDA